MKYIKQRGENDCGIAALAMACGMKYEDVANGLVTGGATALRLIEVGENGALNDSIIKSWLIWHDWAWQEVTANLWLKGKPFPQHPWPPRPFALTHICFVEATRNWHYCVMDDAGRVYDPWNDQRHSLDHPDYKRVASVIGLYKIKGRLDSVRSPTP